MTTMDEEYLLGAQSAMDDWKYEMRREIQEIVPNLYLGPFSACRKTEELKALGITHIVCIVDQNEARLFRTEVLSQHFEYQQYIVSDSNLQNLIQYFPGSSQYIYQATQKGKVVVCCNGGMSRSPAFVVAYIMEIFKIDASQAYRYVQAKRLCINPNDGFKSQLKEYEPIYKARQLNIIPSNQSDTISRRRRRQSGPDEEDGDNTDFNYYDQNIDTKRFLGLESQQQNSANANTNAGYSSMLL